MAYDYPYIRDEVRINAYVQAFYDQFVGDGPVYLLGRRVSHEAGFNLRVGSRSVIIIADIYDGAGRMIDASGAYPSGNGGTVTVRCRRSINAQINVSGAAGADGYAGVNGSDGVPEDAIEGHYITVMDPGTGEEREEWVPREVIHPAIPEVPPGRGGPGGAGGNAGTLVFTSLEECWPSLAAEGGAGGAGGPGGTLGDIQAEEGSFGANGRSSAIGYSIVSEQDYLNLIRSDLGIYANYWAPFRIVTGIYFYHRYNSRIADRSSYLPMAVAEFAAALAFQPDNSDAVRYYNQLVGAGANVAHEAANLGGGGNNALGLPRNMDLLPRFDYYFDAYTSFGALALAFLNNGTQWLLGAEGYAAMVGFASQQRFQMQAARDNSADELNIAKAEQKDAEGDITYAQQRVDSIIREIQAARPVMPPNSFTIGGLIGNIASIAGAVASIAAAIPSGGASLVALVPSLVALEESLSKNAEPIVKSLLDDAKVNDQELDEVKKSYEKVGKNVDSLVKGGKTIVSFVKLVQSMNASAASMPDSSKYVALVKQGTELVHALLVARNRAVLAQQRVDAAISRLARANDVVASVDALSEKLRKKEHKIKDIGLAAIEIASSKAQALQTLAFRAQRSVEIYTLQDQEENVLLDAGMISPDICRAYDEEEIGEAGLANELMASWGGILNPVNMKLTYISFFDARPDWDTYRRSFTEGPELHSLRSSFRFNFRIETSDLPSTHFDTKVKNILVAFVGAKSGSSEISCIVRHGAKYEQRRREGAPTIQLLTPQFVNRRAKTERLDRPVANLDSPLDAPTSLSIWGRGVGGDWEIAIEQHEVESGSLDLSQVTEIQVWIDYQFVR